MDSIQTSNGLRKWFVCQVNTTDNVNRPQSLEKNPEEESSSTDVTLTTELKEETEKQPEEEETDHNESETELTVSTIEEKTEEQSITQEDGQEVDQDFKVHLCSNISS